MDEAQVAAYIQLAQIGLSAGILVANDIEALIAKNHSSMTDADRAAAFAAIMADDGVQAALAHQAATGQALGGQ